MGRWVWLDCPGGGATPPPALALVSLGSSPGGFILPASPGGPPVQSPHCADGAQSSVEPVNPQAPSPDLSVRSGPGPLSWRSRRPPISLSPETVVLTLHRREEGTGLGNLVQERGGGGGVRAEAGTCRSPPWLGSHPPGPVQHPPTPQDSSRTVEAAFQDVGTLRHTQPQGGWPLLCPFSPQGVPHKVLMVEGGGWGGGAQRAWRSAMGPRPGPAVAWQPFAPRGPWPGARGLGAALAA